jgi:SAM-dependent methyltransferase
MNTSAKEPMTNLRLDLGCGDCKKEGTLGVDMVTCPGVDYTLDIQNEPLPFSNGSVEYIHSSHFLEHLEDPSKVFLEVSRVCQDGAKLEFWTPYAWTNDAFLFGHTFSFTEELYLHLCCKYPEVWQKVLNARWILKEITYTVNPDTILEISREGVSLDFALKHYINIVSEIGFFVEVRHNYSGETPMPLRTFAFNRQDQRYPIKTTSKSSLLLKFEMAQALLKEMSIRNFIPLFMKRLKKK